MYIGSSEVILLLFVWQNNSIWFFLRPMTNAVSGYWLLYQCWVWIPSHGVSLESSQKLVGYFCNICAVIAPMYLVSQAGHCCGFQGV